jgi:RNA polymerase sigma factor (sigma-70 family)
MTAADDLFIERFDALARVAYHAAFRLLASRPEAEDVAQEALARAYAGWPIAGNAEAWVTRVATNLAIDRCRRRRPTANLVESVSNHLAPSTDDAGPRIDLARALAALPRRQREVIALRYLVDMAEADVALALQTTVGAVKQHHYRAIRRLRADIPNLHLDSEIDDAQRP